MTVALLCLAAIGALLAGHVAVARWQRRRHLARMYAEHGAEWLAEIQRRMSAAFADGLISPDGLRLNVGWAVPSVDAGAAIRRVMDQIGVAFQDAVVNLGHAFQAFAEDLSTVLGPALRRLQEQLEAEPPWVANSRLDAELPPMPEEALDECPICGDLTADLERHDRESGFMHDLLIHIRQPIEER